MRYDIFKLPLYSDASYRYDYVIEEVSYTFEFYYNTLMESWIYNVSYSDGTPILTGSRLSPDALLTLRYDMGWGGFLYLSPIGSERLETISNPYEIYKYYELFYYSPVGAVEPEEE